MAGWYSVGTVTVTNGSTVVTGAGTDFVNNALARDAFALLGGTLNEIASIQSATQLTLARPWLGASGGGQAYIIVPTVGIYVDLALRALNMLGPFQAVLDGIGQGLIPDGTVAAPGIRFLSDQDSGFRRTGENSLALVTGGVDRLSVNAVGNVYLDGPKAIVSNGPGQFTLQNPADAGSILVSAGTTAGYTAGLNVYGGGTGSNPNVVAIFTGSVERLRVDSSGNLVVGAATATTHTIARIGVSEGTPLVVFANTGVATALQVFASNVATASSAAAAMRLSANGTTGRSINAAGTINASGADYAEYVVKAAGCGTIAPGDVCGIDADGHLTRTWADAVSFVVKSTDPAYVGGDSWARHLPPRPDAPGAAPVEPIAPISTAPAQAPVEPVREDGEDDGAFMARMAAYLVAASAAIAAASADADALAAYHAALAVYPAAKAQHDAAEAAYESALSAWEADFEEQRQTVDRIAFSGQVPVNIDGAFAVGDYLIAAANGGGIHAVAVPAADITFDQYRRRIGKVWASRDGRPWVDVQHG